MVVIIIPILLVILALSWLSSHFIAKAAYKKLKMDNNENAQGWRILIFILSFIGIAACIFFLIVNNIRIER
jgi:hypothetical protein